MASSMHDDSHRHHFSLQVSHHAMDKDPRSLISLPDPPRSIESVSMRHRMGVVSKRKPFVVYHAILQVSAIAVLACGVLAVYFSKQAGMHLITAHALIGAAALALVSANVSTALTINRLFSRYEPPRSPPPRPFHLLAGSKKNGNFTKVPSTFKVKL